MSTLRAIERGTLRSRVPRSCAAGASPCGHPPDATASPTGGAASGGALVDTRLDVDPAGDREGHLEIEGAPLVRRRRVTVRPSTGCDRVAHPAAPHPVEP